MNKSTIAIITSVSLLVFCSSSLARGERDGRGGGRDFSRGGQSEHFQGGNDNHLRGTNNNIQRGGENRFQNGDNNVNRTDTSFHGGANEINGNDVDRVDSGYHGGVNDNTFNTGNTINTGNVNTGNAAAAERINNGNAINQVGDRAVVANPANYQRYVAGAYYYGPGTNQTWCANNVAACVTYCNANQDKCSTDGTNFYIVSP